MNKAIALLITFGCISEGSTMEVPKFANGIGDEGVRELIQTWEKVRKFGECDFQAHSMILGNALDFIEKYSSLLKTRAGSGKVNLSSLSLVMNGLYSLCNALEVDTSSTDGASESLPPTKLTGGAVFDFGDLVDDL